MINLKSTKSKDIIFSIENLNILSLHFLNAYLQNYKVLTNNLHNKLLLHLDLYL
jgi:hypothetical protein